MHPHPRPDEPPGRCSSGVGRVLLGGSALLAVLLALGLGGAAVAQQPGVNGAEIVENEGVVVDPVATVPGVTPTPDTSATVVPFETPTPVPGETPTPVPPPTAQTYSSPGYGNAAQQSPADKRREYRRACNATRPAPVSHMLGVPGRATGGSGGSIVPLIIAVAAGAAAVALVAYVARKSGPAETQAGPLERIATLVAICGGVAGLVAQFVPGVRVDEEPPQEATMVVRDVKPRITRGEYLTEMRFLKEKNRLPREDLAEVGNVVWLEITVTGFEGRRLQLQYGLYDLDAREALLPGTSKPVELIAPSDETETYFYPAWVGYPRSAHFKAEFRLIDPADGGVQQLAATGPMRGARYRYDCSSSR